MIPLKHSRLTVGEFMSLIDHAGGNVYLVTEDGVYFNLNSKLAQLYCIRLLLDQKTKQSVKLKFERPEDEAMFHKFLLLNE